MGTIGRILLNRHGDFRRRPAPHQSVGATADLVFVGYEAGTRIYNAKYTLLSVSHGSGSFHTSATGVCSLFQGHWRTLAMMMRKTDKTRHRARIFWKMSRITLRELFSLSEVSPKYKNDSISAFLGLQENLHSVIDSSRALLGATDSNRTNAAARQIRNQELNIDRLVNSVNELHGTMRDLQQAFTGLRTEFNESGTRNTERTGGEMDMFRTLVTELGKKSKEIDKLRLENESLKGKVGVLEECNKRLSASAPVPLEDSSMSGIRSPTLTDLRTQNRRGRQTPFMHSSPHQSVADSFDDEYTEFVDAASGDEPEPPPTKVPLKPADNSGNHVRPSHLNGSSNQRTATSAGDSRGEPQEPTAKRPRLTSGTEDAEEASQAAASETPAVPVKRPRGRPPGRPRKSISQTSRTGDPPFHVETPGTNARRGGRRARSVSRRPPSRRERGAAATSNTAAAPSGQNSPLAHPDGAAEQTPQAQYVNCYVTDTSAAGVSRHAPVAQGSSPTNQNQVDANGDADQRQAKRKSLVSAREALVRQVMEREEAMDGEQ